MSETALDKIARQAFNGLEGSPHYGHVDVKKWKKFLRQFPELPKPKKGELPITLARYPQLNGKDERYAIQALLELGDPFGWGEVMSVVGDKKALGISRLLKEKCQQIRFLNVGNSGVDAHLYSAGPDGERSIYFGRPNAMYPWAGDTIVAFKGHVRKPLGNVDDIPKAGRGGL